jgi:hypothetical protein
MCVQCDQTRPSCSRCVKSRRVCPGYGDDSSLVFRHYQPFEDATSLDLDRWSPGIPSIWEDAAIQIFLDTLVVPSQNRQKSRGFLHGIQSLLTSATPDSALFSAAKVVALAAISNSTRSPELASVVQTLYGSVLRDLTLSLPGDDSTVPVETFLTALLLGLYEVWYCFLHGYTIMYSNKNSRSSQVAMRPLPSISYMFEESYHSFTKEFTFPIKFRKYNLTHREVL